MRKRSKLIGKIVRATSEGAGVAFEDGGKTIEITAIPAR